MTISASSWHALIAVSVTARRLCGKRTAHHMRLHCVSLDLLLIACSLARTASLWLLAMQYNVRIVPSASLVASNAARFVSSVARVAHLIARHRASFAPSRSARRATRIAPLACIARSARIARPARHRIAASRRAAGSYRIYLSHRSHRSPRLAASWCRRRVELALSASGAPNTALVGLDGSRRIVAWLGA